MTTATQAREPQVLNKLMFAKLMPLLIIAYILSFLDRTNIALAKHHLDVDLGISAAAYGLGAGLFFLTYALSEIPSNLIMHKVGARFWIARIMVTWGLISAAMAFVQGETSFYVLRLLLGIAEAGLFPGVMLYLTYWFNREQRARATGYFLLGVCFANIIGGPVGAALMRLDGLLGWHGWQWMFLLEGLPAVAFAWVVWRKLPDRPSQAPWLTAAEAQGIEKRIAQETEEGAGEGGHALKNWLTPQILLAIYVLATLLLAPFAQPAALLRLDGVHWALLLYAALNTLAAYGAFAEALAHWEASRVSAILATTPLLCIVAATAVHAVWPAALAPERIGPTGLVGAMLAVAGSAAVSLLGRPSNAPAQE